MVSFGYRQVSRFVSVNSLFAVSLRTSVLIFLADDVAQAGLGMGEKIGYILAIAFLSILIEFWVYQNWFSSAIATTFGVCITLLLAMVFTGVNISLTPLLIILAATGASAFLMPLLLF